jgi:hypothetical protein
VGWNKGVRLDGEEIVTFIERAMARRRALRQQFENERRVDGSNPWRRMFWALRTSIVREPSRLVSWRA